MAARRRRRRLRKRTRQHLLGWGSVAAVAAVVWLAANWAAVWPVLVVALGVIAMVGIGWRLWRAHSDAVGQDRKWRAQEEAKARELSMTEVDALSWQDFEAYVADLCCRDGCSKVVVSGKSGDLGADVIGYFPDGRKLVVQCKKYAPERSVSSQDMQKFRAPLGLSTERTSPSSSPLAVRSPKPRRGWPGDRTSWPCTGTCWVPGSRRPIWSSARWAGRRQSEARLTGLKFMGRWRRPVSRQ